MDSRATGLSQRHERLERGPFPSGLTQPQAAAQTILRIYNSVITQANVLSYIDVAWLIGVLCLLMIPLVLLLKRNNPKAAVASAE
jgi:hypothetical protein